MQPNSEHTYYWEASPKVSPQPNDPTCLTYTYISHEQFVEDFNSGLIGALLVCKPGKKRNIYILLSLLVAALWLPVSFLNLPNLTVSEGSLDESGNQIGVHHEYVFLFGVFDENQSEYKQNSYTSDNIKYTINGYAKGSLPGEYIALTSLTSTITSICSHFLLIIVTTITN